GAAHAAGVGRAAERADQEIAPAGRGWRGPHVAAGSGWPGEPRDRDVRRFARGGAASVGGDRRGRAFVRSSLRLAGGLCPAPARFVTAALKSTPSRAALGLSARTLRHSADAAPRSPMMRS